MKIFVSAGEVSGDVHGSYLVRELKKLSPNLSFFGIGSDRLASAGVDVRFDISRRGTIGLLEALPNIFPLFSIFNRVKTLLKKEKPDLAILIDSQGFNLPLARFCKKIGVKTVYYIAPQEWLWGTERGLKNVVNNVDLIVAIFEKEFNIYKKAGANVVYFGHPLLDIGKPSGQKLPFENLPRPLISLCPGSRLQEIRDVFPVILRAASLVQSKIPKSSFLIPAANLKFGEELVAMIRNPEYNLVNSYVLPNRADDLLAISDLAICTSGTINLEASILGVPNIMVYKLSPLTYFIGKYLLHIDRKLKYFSMPNILLDENVVPELTMDQATPEAILREAINILNDRSVSEKMRRDFSRLKSLMGAPGVINKVANSILNFLSPSKMI